MAADFTSKQGDAAPALADTLTYSDGSAAVLSGATVTFIARSLSSQTPLVLSGTTTVTNPSLGQVQFTPTTADTSAPGLYMCNWLVTFGSGAAMTFPTVGYISWSIEENLTTPGGQQLVGLPDVKDYLGIPANEREYDAKLLRYVSAVTPMIENIAGPVIVRTFDEWHDGGQYWIQLRRRPSFAVGMNPVLSLMACEEYRGPIRYDLSVVADPSSAGIYSVMLDARVGTVYRRSTGGGVIPFGAGAWGGGMPQAVHVLYEAGQSPVPWNVYEAALEAIRVNYQTTIAVGRGARTRADELESGAPLGFFMPRRVLEMLAPLRRHPAVA